MLFLSYAYRSLLARFRANLVSVLAVSLFIIGSSLGLAYYVSLDDVVTSVPENNVIVISKGSESEVDSKIDLDTAHKLVVLEGIQKQNGAPLAVRELMTEVAVTERTQGHFEYASPLRGVDAQSAAIHHVKLIAGTAPQPHSLEIIAGRRIVQRYPHLRVGFELHLPGGPSKITGIFSAEGSGFEDELWTDHAALELHSKRPASSMTLVAENAQRAAELVTKINGTKDLDVQAFTVAAFGARLAGLKTVVRTVLVLLILLTIVATSAIATTMNAAVVVRLPELAALAAIGIRKRALARVVLVESLLLGLVGGLIGVLASALVIARYGFITIGQYPVELSSSPVVLVIGLTLGVLAGTLGGLAPAIQVRRVDILATLR